MDNKPTSVDRAVQAHCRNGAIGFLLRKMRRAAGARPLPTAIGRRALKKVAPKAAAPSAGRTGRGRRRVAGDPRQAAAEQAALGLLTDDLDQADGFDPKRLQARLDKMPPADLEHLARLLVAARTKADGEARPALDRLSEQLAAKGFKLEVQGNNNAITISLGDPPDAAGKAGDGAEGGFGSLAYSSWGRQHGRVRHFLEGR